MNARNRAAPSLVTKKKKEKLLRNKNEVAQNNFGWMKPAQKKC